VKRSSRATFTCDFCQTPVDLFADQCPSCGKRFDAVRCPRCGHQGAPAAFRDGCPKCGYLSSPREPRRTVRSPAKGSSSVFVPLMAVTAVLLVLAFAVSWLLRGR